MEAQSGKKTHLRLNLATIGLCLGGLAPLITGAIGIWGYMTQGYFIAKTGEVIDDRLGMVVCILFIIAGLGMIGYAVWSFQRKKRSNPLVTG